MSDNPPKPPFETTEAYRQAYHRYDMRVIEKINAFEKAREHDSPFTSIEFHQMIYRHALELRELTDAWVSEVEDLRQKYEQGEL